MEIVTEQDQLDNKLLKLKGKKLLILAGAGAHNKVVNAAKELGIYTIVTDYLPDSPAKKIADESWMYNITEVDGIVERCRKEGVDGVINFCIDPGQKPYQQICERLGFPCYGTKEQFDIMTDKRKFKSFCLANDVDIVPEYSEEDIYNDVVDYPVFIKPTDSRGSRGESVCYCKEETLRAIVAAKNESSDDSFVCEKYMQGKQDIASAFWVIDGEPYLLKLGDRHLGQKEDNLDKQAICTELPSRYTLQIEDNVLPRVKKMIHALGIKFGPVFMQGFVDGDTVRFYDPALRMPGGDYDLILKEATGFDSMTTMIYFALTGDTKVCFGNISNAYMLKGKHAILLTASVKPGMMTSVTGFKEVISNPYVIYGRQIIKEGSVIPATGDIQQRVVTIGALFPDKSYVKKFTDDFYNTYKVLDSDGNDMIISRWDYRT